MKQCQVLKKSTNQVQAFDWGALEWFANKTLSPLSDLTVGKCILKPGQANASHMHPNCMEVLYVQEGTIRHTLAGKKTAFLKAGDTIVIPAQLYHHARNVGKKKAVLFISFSTGQRRVKMKG